MDGWRALCRAVLLFVALIALGPALHADSLVARILAWACIGGLLWAVFALRKLKDDDSQLPQAERVKAAGTAILWSPFLPTTRRARPATATSASAANPSGWALPLGHHLLGAQLVPYGIGIVWLVLAGPRLLDPDYAFAGYALDGLAGPLILAVIFMLLLQIGCHFFCQLVPAECPTPDCIGPIRLQCEKPHQRTGQAVQSRGQEFVYVCRRCGRVEQSTVISILLFRPSRRVKPPHQPTVPSP